jgi:hypothetical protein
LMSYSIMLMKLPYPPIVLKTQPGYVMLP